MAKKIKVELTTREVLINAIIDFASDEFESSDDYIKLAKKSEIQLIKELISICEYFRDREIY
jgi:hypothetical protein